MVPQTGIPNAEQLEWMQVKLKVGSRVVSGDLAEDLAIPSDPEDLLEALSKSPSMYFYWSTATEVAKADVERAKRRFEMWYADKYKEARKELIEEIGKSYLTDTLIKSRIFETDGETYEELQDAIITAEYKKGVLAFASKAFLERGNSMINILSWRKQDRLEQRSAS